MIAESLYLFAGFVVIGTKDAQDSGADDIDTVARIGV
jgi:hypothetical protein